MKPLHLAALLVALAGPLFAQEAVPPVVTVVAPAPVAVVAPTVSGTAVDQAAPAVDQLAALYAWVKTQQANAGISYDLHRVKYACTWWDLISLGSSGMNVGIATAKDYLDLGPAMATANAAPTRYGQGTALHVGNIWNAAASALPGNVAKHVKITSLPDVTVGGLFLFPKSGALNKWTWRDDFQAAIAYRFGGS